MFVAVMAAATPASATTPILWDLTHGVYEGYEPAGRYSDLVSSLGALGYTVETTSAGIDNVDLLSYAILVIGAGSCHDTPYTAAETAAAQAYAAAGGSILILGDNPGVWPENLNPLAQALGTTTAVGGIAPNVVIVDNFAAHPIFSGVMAISLVAAGTLSADTSVPVAWAPGGPVVVTVGAAEKVVVLGDLNLFENQYLADSGNAAFATSLFTWLHEPAPVENVTWGAIKVLWSARRQRVGLPAGSARPAPHPAIASRNSSAETGDGDIARFRGDNQPSAGRRRGPAYRTLVMRSVVVPAGVLSRPK